jgi:hypothetical protein
MFQPSDTNDTTNIVPSGTAKSPYVRLQSVQLRIADLEDRLRAARVREIEIHAEIERCPTQRPPAPVAMLGEAAE